MNETVVVVLRKLTAYFFSGPLAYIQLCEYVQGIHTFPELIVRKRINYFVLSWNPGKREHPYSGGRMTLHFVGKIAPDKMIASCIQIIKNWRN